MPGVIQAQARSPHALAVAAACAISGSVQLIMRSQPQSILASSNYWSADLWSILLVLGGGTVLVGTFFKNVSSGLRIEHAGHVAIFFGTVIYAISAAMWFKSPWGASPAFWWATAFAVASAARWWTIFRALRGV